MTLRKASAYSFKYTRPYTRKSKVKQKSYIKAVPNTAVVKLRHGDLKGWRDGKYPIILKIYSLQDMQWRDNSIESVRQYLNRFLQERISKDFYFEVFCYPHHVMRENRLQAGAGADRLSTGMAHSFGTTIGRAALIKKGQLIMLIGVQTQKQDSDTRKLIHAVKARMPGNISVQTEYKK